MVSGKICWAFALVLSAWLPPTFGAEGGCSSDQALSLVKAADEAAASQHWLEARTAYDRAEEALRGLMARCPGKLADRAEMLLSSLPSSRETVQAGLARTVCPTTVRKARELDEQAVQQGEKKDWTAAVRSYTDAEAAWREASDLCRGDDQRAAVAAQAQSAAGRKRAADQVERPACRNDFMEGVRLKSAARAEWENGRLQEATKLYRDAERVWLGALNNCVGSRRIQAGKERDAARAESESLARCAPAWQQATNLSERYKSLAPSVPGDARLALHHRLEIHWGQAADSCRGRQAEIAHAQVRSLAQERGNVPLPALSALPEMKDWPAAPPVAGDIPEMTVRVGDMVFAGRFQRDVSNLTLSGQGRVTWDNGNVFAGTLILGKAEGKGSMSWRNGDRYEGQWKYDLPHGQGSMVYGDGGRFEGEFTAGKPEGNGRLTHASGDRYEGDFRDGLPEGWGTYFWKSGDRFEGSWKEGRKNGPGRMIWSNGDSAEGWYENDRQVPGPAESK